MFDQGDYERAQDTIKILEQKIRELGQRIRELEEENKRLILEMDGRLGLY